MRIFIKYDKPKEENVINQLTKLRVVFKIYLKGSGMVCVESNQLDLIKKIDGIKAAEEYKPS